MTMRKGDADLPLDGSIGTHAVYISYRGIEMQRKFANHLYHSLTNRGIKAFLDTELPKGADVGSFRLEAVRRAIIQVPIITSIYAESMWCLDELVEMMKSTKSSNNAKVLPVFYDVKSEDLTNKDGPFAEAIKYHRKEGKRNEDTIQGWEDALNDASWLEGFRMETYNKCEGALLKDLVEKIVLEIKDRALGDVDLLSTMTMIKGDADLPLDETVGMPEGDADLPLDETVGTPAVFISNCGIELERKFANHLYHSLEGRGIKAFLDMKEHPEGGDARPYMQEAAWRAIIQVPIFTSTYAEYTWCLDELVEMMKSTKSSMIAKVLPVFYDVRPEDLRNKDGPFAKAIKAHREKGKHYEETIKGWEDALNEASWHEGFLLETYNRCEGELLKDLVEKIVQEIKDGITLGDVDLLSTITMIKGDADLPLDKTVGTPDVFISHCGSELKHKFANHLYHSLEDRGIKAFLGMKEHPGGGDARPYILEAARRATIQVPIFTSTYAEYTWCLDELVEMIKSTKSSMKAKVLPVFYDVKSEDLRKKDGPFGKAIKAHREKGKRNEKTIQEWEDALNDASWHEGFWLENYDRYEGELLKALVEKIVQEINDRTLGVPNAVGLEGRVHIVVELFHLKQMRYVFFLLLWGMGGIGKTALAQSIFIRLGKEFQATSFVENCRDEETNRIQQSLLNDLLLQNNFTGDVGRGREYLKRSLSGRKVLIILDDVLDFESIETVIDLTSLHPGSLILVTSRNQRVFPSETALSDVFKAERYEVQGLGGDESLQLLCLNAFKKPFPDPGFELLAEKVSQACGGHALSLEVLGRHLRRKKQEMWEDAIKKLKSNEYREIESRLMISYEALSVQEQEMFLDVACFLIGEDKRSAEYFWDGLEKEWRTGLERLVCLCFVKVGKIEHVGEDECLTMHDTLRDFGRAIVEKEYKRSGKWSRVWDDTDLLQVLGSKQGLDQIRGIATSLPNLSVGLLSQMRSLQLLFLDGTQVDGDDEGLKGLKIRWLKLTYYEGTPKEILDMKFVTVLKLEVGTYGMKLEFPFFYGQLKQLRKLVMDGCIMSEDFGSFESLEELDVRGSAIRSLPSSFGQLKKLRKLHMPRCYPLEQLPERLAELNLRGSANKEVLSPLASSFRQLTKRLKLDMFECDWSEQLPEEFGTLESLEELDVRESRIMKLPSSFGQLKKLRKLDLSQCKQLAQLPEDFGSLEGLEELYVRELKIRMLPSSFWQLRKLRKLDLSGCKWLEQLPEDFESLERLKELNVRGSAITNVPSSFSQLKKLQKLDMHGCYQLEHLPKDFGSLESLEELDVQGSAIRNLPSSFGQLRKLWKLDMSGCHWLEQLPEEFGTLVESLKELDVRDLRITKLSSSFGQLKKLRKLDMSGCKQLVQLPEDFGSLESLEELYVRELRITILPSSFLQLKKLRKLDLSGCEWLEPLPDFRCLVSLEELHVSQTPIMKRALWELEKVE